MCPLLYVYILFANELNVIWSVGRSVGRMVGRLVDWLVGLLVSGLHNVMPLDPYVLFTKLVHKKTKHCIHRIEKTQTNKTHIYMY